MNTKENQRFQETKEKIEQVFQELLREEEFSKITVAEICRRANIHRTTFYGHYMDVLDLMDQMARDMYSDFMGAFLADEKFHMKEGFLAMFTFIRNHQEFFRNYINTSWRQQNRRAKMPEMLESDLGRLIREFGYQSEEELLYHQAFFTGGLVAMISRWIGRGCPEEPEELYRLLVDEYETQRSIFQMMR